MNIDLATKEDLEKFRIRLLEDIRKLIEPKETENNSWLRSGEVRKMLKISPGSLQNLRIAGKLNPRKIGGTYYYPSEEVQGLFKK
jgi:hypothetical protein